jgi:hypothetical protein
MNDDRIHPRNLIAQYAPPTASTGDQTPRDLDPSDEESTNDRADDSAGGPLVAAGVNEISESESCALHLRSLGYSPEEAARLCAGPLATAPTPSEDPAALMARYLQVRGRG